MPPKQPEIREEDVRNAGVSYEPREADLRVVLWFLAALGLATLLVILVLWGMYTYFLNRTQGNKNLPGPSMYSSQPSIPRPQLQPDPVADNNVYRQTEERQLDSYGWVDEKAGITHIPIDRAMDMLVRQGLPWKAPGTGPVPTGAVMNPASGPMPGAARSQQDLGKNKQ